MLLRFTLGLAAITGATSALAQTSPPAPPSEEQARFQAEMARYNAMPDTPGSGAFPAIKEMVAALPEHTVYRPADLAKIPADKLGIVGWGNGGCAADGASQRLHLSEIASHGYVVIAPGRIASGPGSTPAPQPAASENGQLQARTTADQVWQGVEWALAENARPGGPLYQKIDPTKIAVSGFSCGGLQALQLADKPGVKAVVIHNSGVFGATTAPMGGMSISKDQLNKLRTPVIYINGGPTDIAYENGMDDYRRINHVPALMLNQDSGHGGTFNENNGGVAAQVAVHWLQWQLRGNKRSGSMFVGANCGLCTDSHWTVERKNFPDKLD